MAGRRSRAGGGETVSTRIRTSVGGVSIEVSRLRNERLKRLCVFCGANAGNGPRYRDASEALGHALVRAGIGLVYGGAGIGLMGIIADATIRPPQPPVDAADAAALTAALKASGL